MFSDHSVMRYRSQGKKPLRITKTWRLNNPLLNNQQATKEIKREIKVFLETNGNENTPQNLCKISCKSEVYSNKILPQETRKASKRHPNITPKQLAKGEQKYPKISRRK